MRILVAALVAFSMSVAAVRADQGSDCKPGTAGCSQTAKPARKLRKRRSCVEDAKRLCQGVQPGNERIGACLWAHFNQLSPGCKEVQRAKHGGPPSR